MNIIKDFQMRIQGDIIAGVTMLLLIGSVALKVTQALVLHFMTEYYPLEMDTMINTVIGLAPGILLLIYMICYYKTQKTQILLTGVFVLHFTVTTLYAWLAYPPQEGLTPNFVFENLIWMVYYAFLVFVTYKGFEGDTVIRIVMGIMILYSVAGSVVTWATVLRIFPEEVTFLTSQAIAILGNICYYAATFLIVPKAIKEVDR